MSILLNLLVEFYCYKHSERTIHLVLFEGCVSLFASYSDRPPSMNHQQLGHGHCHWKTKLTIVQIAVHVRIYKKDTGDLIILYIQGRTTVVCVLLINNRKQETRNNPLKHRIDHFMYKFEYAFYFKHKIWELRTNMTFRSDVNALYIRRRWNK